jgi:chemotaxis protein methyltransferase CheR
LQKFRAEKHDSRIYTLFLPLPARYFWVMNLTRMEFEPSPKITKEAFDQISAYINRHYGINLTEAKRNLVENRLFKRLRHLHMNSYAQYINHIFDPTGKQELDLLCDFLSTNKTYFYREPAHFDFLQNLINNSTPGRHWKVWSAASSSGDEAYTLSCLFEEGVKKKALQYNILGTDISSRMIDEAREAKYTLPRISPLPTWLTKTYFDKTRDDKGQEWYSANLAIRKNVAFRTFNLIKDIPTLPGTFDIIFCRNVLIYFKEEMKHQVVAELIRKLSPGGFLFLAHCEGMLCRNTELKQVSPAVFQKTK